MLEILWKEEIMVRVILIVSLVITIFYIWNKYKFVLKSIYQTLKVNSLLRMRLFRIVFSVISRLIFKRKIF